MRQAQRVRLLAVAASVMVAVALVPGSVPPGGGPNERAPESIRRLVTLVARDDGSTGETVVESVHPAPDHPQASAGPATEPPADPETGIDELAPAPASDPSTFVATMDVLGTGGPTWIEPPPGDEPCPKASSCPSHAVRHQKWPTDETGTVRIPWRFNDEGRRNLRAPAGLLEGAVRRGMAEWGRWNSNIRFAYAGTTTATFGAEGSDGSCADGTNTVTWHRFDPSIIAAVLTCIDPATNTVRDADLALNVTQHWERIDGEPESRHTFDIDSIVTHELGHWLSLLDLYDGGSLHQTMMGNAPYGETRKRTLALGDVIGLQTAYPCDPDDTCPRTGIVED